LQSSIKINYDLFKSINDAVKHPFIIFDVNGNILSINRDAGELFGGVKENDNIFDILNDGSSVELAKLFENVTNNGNVHRQTFKFSLITGQEINVTLNISKYVEDNQTLLFVSLTELAFKLNITDARNIRIKSCGGKDLFNNKDIKPVLDDFKYYYPFTLVGKEKFRKVINSFPELIWVEDFNGNIQIINNKIANGLNVKHSQMEGKPERNFIPAYFYNFEAAVDCYIKETLNTVVTDGVPFQITDLAGLYETVKIPIVDSEDKPAAILAVSQMKREKMLPCEDAVNLSSNLFINSPKALAIINNKGIIKHQSKEFIKLFHDKFANTESKNFKKIFPKEISLNITDFIKSNDDSRVFNFRNSNYFGGKEAAIHLAKIKDDEDNFKAVSVVIDEIKFIDNIEQLILNRGRMFDILIKNNPEPIFIYDKEDLVFLEVNDAALNMYGYKKDEFLQMDLTDLYTPEDIQTLLDSSSGSAKEGEFNGPFRHKKKDGSSIFVEISKVSFNFQNKEAHFNIVRDVSSQLEIKKQAQLYKSAFDNTDNLVLISDNGGFINYINKPGLVSLGFNRSEIEGASFTSLVKDEERGNVNSAIFQSHLKEEISFTIELKTKSGNFIEADLTATPVMDYNDEVESFVIIGKVKQEPVKEDTPPKEVIKEIIKEVYIDRPAPAQPIAADKPSGSNISFLSNIFHEILTPINVILGFVQELTDSIENPTPDQKEASEIINQNRTMLLNTMNSFIEYNSISKQEPELAIEEIAITDIIEKVQSEVDAVADSKNIEFAYGKISSSLKFYSDREKFQSLLSLLVKIILQLNKEKKIYFSAYQYDDDNFVIALKDNYSTISSYLLHSLSTILSDDDPGGKDYGVSKLLVQSAKKLLSLLDGKFVTLEKEAKKETGFLFPINLSDKSSYSPPVVKEEIVDIKPVETDEKNIFQDEEETFAPEDFTSLIEEEESEPESAQEPEKVQEPEPEVSGTSKFTNKIELKRFNCLYIEDQVDSQILFKVQMKDLNDIKFAVSFEEALPLLDSNTFDFIVMDINLQGEYNGLDALKIIHKMPGYENIPIIAVTAYVLPGDKEKFIATGFSDFISKPIFREKMIESLEKIYLLQI
jgi:PAS domain S-box-containing protein